MRFTNAVLRLPGPNLGEGLTTAAMGAPDHALALAQHARYVTALEEAGVRTTVLEPLSAFPDAHFVEDAAVVTPEVAVIARLGAPPRRGEEAFIEPALARHRSTVRIREPGTLDGGDVLVAGRRVLVGLSERTNERGAIQLRETLSPLGYEVVAVAVGGGLHLKSSVNLVSEETLLVARAFVGHPALAGFRQLAVAAGDEYSANVLWVNERLLMPAGFPRTRALLEPIGTPIVELDVSEFRKMDGGLTCLSIRLGDAT